MEERRMATLLAADWEQVTRRAANEASPER